MKLIEAHIVKGGFLLLLSGFSPTKLAIINKIPHANIQNTETQRCYR